MNSTNIKLPSMKKAMAKQMIRSLEIPQFLIETEVDCGKLMELRKTVDYKPTVTTVFAKAVIVVLKNHPMLNSSFVDVANVAVHDTIGLGIAADTPKGLVVPVIHNAGELSLKEFHAEMEIIKKKSQNGNFTMEDLMDGTFTISNLGMFNVTSFKAIVNPPQTAILALSKIVEKPVIRNGEIKTARIMRISLSADHRVMDGACCARFITELTEVIENPESLFE